MAAMQMMADGTQRLNGIEFKTRKPLKYAAFLYLCYLHKSIEKY